MLQLIIYILAPLILLAPFAFMISKRSPNFNKVGFYGVGLLLSLLLGFLSGVLGIFQSDVHIFIAGLVVVPILYGSIYFAITFRNRTHMAPIEPERQVKESFEETQESFNKNIFISYRRNDSADVAGRIYDRLANKFGEDNVFKDVDSIPLGADFRDFIEASISNSFVLLVVIGKSWLGQSNDADSRRIDDPQDFPRIEIAAALKKNIPIIPVLVFGSSVPKERELPIEISNLAHRNGVQIRPDPDFNHDISRLIVGIEKIANHKNSTI